MKQMSELIPMPHDLFKAKERIAEREKVRELFHHDEVRLFYVAITRAKSSLIFTASPSESSITSSFLKTLGLSGEVSTAREEEIATKYLSKAEGRDPLIGTEKVVRDMVSDMTLNPTRLNNYITCRRKFFYNDVLKLPGPKKRSLVFGNCVHKALEETYLEYRKTGSFPPFDFFMKAFELELKFQGVDRAIEMQCRSHDQVAKLKKWFSAASLNPVMPLGLERKLTITIGDNIIFTGKYDKLEWDDESKGTVRIVDYKTGKPDDHLKAIESYKDLRSDACDGYLRQLVAYKLLYERDLNESKGRKVATGALVFIEPVFADMRKLGYRKGDCVTKTVEITADMVIDLESLIIDTWKDIKRLRFEKLAERDGDKCGRCEFDNMCWG